MQHLRARYRGPQDAGGARPKHPGPRFDSSCSACFAPFRPAFCRLRPSSFHYLTGSTSIEKLTLASAFRSSLSPPRFPLSPRSVSPRSSHINHFVRIPRRAFVLVLRFQEASFVIVFWLSCHSALVGFLVPNYFFPRQRSHWTPPSTRVSCVLRASTSGKRTHESTFFESTQQFRFFFLNLYLSPLFLGTSRFTNPASYLQRCFSVCRSSVRFQ